MGGQVSNATEHHFNKTGMTLTICGMTHFFTFDTILLSGEGEGNKRGRKELEVGAG